MMLRLPFFATAAAGLVFTAMSSQAGTIDYSEGMTEAANAILVEEKKGVSASGVVVDYVVGTNVSLNTQFTGVNSYDGNGLTLADGVYDSYLIHFDPIGTNGGTSSGSFSFSGDIVALILSNGNGRNGGTSSVTRLLNASDAVFGMVGNTFETDLSRRSENNGVDGNGDLFRLTSANTLQFQFQTGSRYIDNVRVITAPAPVPVPASLPLLLAGLGGMAYLKRRRKA